MFMSYLHMKCHIPISSGSWGYRHKTENKRSISHGPHALSDVPQKNWLTGNIPYYETVRPYIISRP
jgi:hypothetical protein